LAIAHVDEWTSKGCIIKKLNLNKFIANLMERDKVYIDSSFIETKTLEKEIQKQLNGLKYE
jgi:hypothetical protein